MVQIRLDLDKVTKKWLISFLQENVNTFSWSTTDIPKIDLEMMVHKLNIDPTYHPMKQKKQDFVLECQKEIIEEINKLVKAGFIQKMMYPDWLANVVLVKKANGKW